LLEREKFFDHLAVRLNLRWLSRLNWFLGKKDDAENYATQAVKILEGLTPDSELAMAYSNRAQLHALAQETAEALHWGHRAIASRSLGSSKHSAPKPCSRSYRPWPSKCKTS
jgi:hypothetical protein